MSRALRFARLNLPLIVVALVIAVAVALVLADRWRRGAFVFGGATILAGVLRWVLDESRVGVLAVRSKGFDVGALLDEGGVIVALAASIHPHRTG